MKKEIKLFILSIIPYANFVWKWEVCKMMVEWEKKHGKPAG